MSQISKAQWEQIEERLKGFFVHFKFELNGHEISVTKERAKENQYCLVVYIDSTFKGIWVMGGKDPECDPIVQQVWRKRSRAMYSPSQKAKLTKIMGVRRAKKAFPNWDHVTLYWTPEFKTAASLVRQFKKIPGLTLVTQLEADHARHASA